MRKKKLQIEVETLRKLCKIAKKCFSNLKKSLIFQCIVTVLFFGLFRISELLGDQRLGIPPLGIEQVHVSKEKAVISIWSYKHSKGDETKIELLKQRESRICPVNKLQRLINLIGKRNGNLLSIRGLGSISKHKFNQMLRKCCKLAGTPNYTSHCFRIGGANLAEKLGRTDAEIRLLGRWKSNALNVYLRKADPLNPLAQANPWPSRYQQVKTKTSREAALTQRKAAPAPWSAR